MSITDNIAAVGEKAIHKLLNRGGHEATLVPYNTVEEQFMQNNGCDILETWTDADGKDHEVWNEVKTEKWTLNSKRIGANAVQLWQLFREAIEVQNETGTGNVFIEFMQGIPQELVSNSQWKDSNFSPLDETAWKRLGIRRGWYPKYRHYEQTQTNKRNESHYIWFVFRVNPDKVTEKDVITFYPDGNIQVGDWMTGGGCVAIKTTLRRLIEIVESNKEKYDSKFGPFDNSWGLLVPVKDIWWVADDNAMWLGSDRYVHLAKVPSDDRKAWFYDVGTITGGDVDLLP